MKKAGLLICLLLAAFSLSQTTQQRPKPIVDIREMMSASEFNKAGLQKLSPEELQALNVWLARYSLALWASREEETTTSAPVIESYIEGEFEGWSGDTIFKLDNGQIWQQDSYAYTYHYAYHPKALIYKTGGRYKMTVEGVSDSIAVKRLR